MAKQSKSSSIKTTVAGLGTLALAIASIFTSPDLSKKLIAVAGVVTSSGLIAAKDHKPSGEAENTQI